MVFDSKFLQLIIFYRTEYLSIWILIIPIMEMLAILVNQRETCTESFYHETISQTSCPFREIKIGENVYLHMDCINQLQCKKVKEGQVKIT